MTRQVIMVFYGKARWHDAHEEHGAHGDYDLHDTEPHESPWMMVLPLVVLAALSLAGGIINLPFSEETEKLATWLEPVVGVHHSDTAKLPLALVAVAVSLLGIAAAYAVYYFKKVKPVEPKILADAWGYDRAVSAFMGGPGRKAFEGVAWADQQLIDGAVTGTGTLVQGAAGKARKVQSGNLRNYAAAVGVGVVLLLIWFVIGRGIL
jgi:NADH-quinone oxidoreductase subunit L